VAVFALSPQFYIKDCQSSIPPTFLLLASPHTFTHIALSPEFHGGSLASYLGPCIAAWDRNKALL